MTDKPTFEEMIYDDIQEMKKDIKSIDKRLVRVEVRSGFIGAIAAATVLLATKIGTIYAWISGGR